MVNGIRNLKIGKKLYLLVGIALVGMFLIGLLSIRLMGTLNGEIQKIVVKWMPGLVLSEEMNGCLSGIRMNEMDYVISSAMSAASVDAESVAKEISTMDAYVTSYSGYVNTTKGSQLYDALKTAWSSYKEFDTQVMAVAAENGVEEALLLMSGEGNTQYQAVHSALTDLIAFNQEGTSGAYGESGTTYKVAVVSQVVLMIVVFIVGIYFSLIIIRGIRQPVAEIEAAAIQMAQGNLEVDISYQSKDEIGVLSDQFRELARKLKAIIDDENHFLASMAAGDFTVDSVCEEEYIGGFHQLLLSFRAIAKRLNEAMLKISDSSNQVSSSSEQVSSGAQALSQGATEQASSIEELASTIAEISNQVKENADNAGRANVMVNSVGNEMNLSNAKMQDMIHAMEDISNCSNEIAKIIKTIEDIASRTNILALNAAVEAARAGTAGKGFAVVADEVRNLASKSADASKDTAALIENSIKAVQNGTQIVNDTAKSLVKAVEDAKEVTQLVDRITEASSTQSTAISQITLGIDQISSVIQTNSATAEQSAAASEELSSQAQIMKDLVSRFKLKGSGGRGIISGGGSAAGRASQTGAPASADTELLYSGVDKY